MEINKSIITKDTPAPAEGSNLSPSIKITDISCGSPVIDNLSSNRDTLSAPSAPPLITTSQDEVQVATNADISSAHESTAEAISPHETDTAEEKTEAGVSTKESSHNTEALLGLLFSAILIVGAALGAALSKADSKIISGFVAVAGERLDAFIESFYSVKFDSIISFFRALCLAALPEILLLTFIFLSSATYVSRYVCCFLLFIRGVSAGCALSYSSSPDAALAAFAIAAVVTSAMLIAAATGAVVRADSIIDAKANTPKIKPRDASLYVLALRCLMFCGGAAAVHAAAYAVAFISVAK